MSERRTARELSPRQGTAWSRLPMIRARKRLHMTMRYRGGAEAWVEIEARGELLRVPGHTAIFDVLKVLCNAPDL